MWPTPTGVCGRESDSKAPLTSDDRQQEDAVTSPKDSSELMTVEIETFWPQPGRSSQRTRSRKRPPVMSDEYPPAANDTTPESSVSQRLPLWKRASTDVLALVMDPEVDALLGRPIPKDRALAALAARRELAERMRRHRWLAIETARVAGATWDEIDTALHYKPGLARREYQAALSNQRTLRLVAPDRHDPGTPQGPQL